MQYFSKKDLALICVSFIFIYEAHMKIKIIGETVRKLVLVNMKKHVYETARAAAKATRRTIAGYVERATVLQIDADIKSGELPKSFEAVVK